MKIGIDLDGVCYGFTEAFCEYVGAPKDFVATKWQFYEDLGLTSEQFLNLCRNAVRQGRLFKQGDMLVGTQPAFAALKDAGHSIHIVTDRCSIDPVDTDLIKQHTLYWLKQNNLPYDSIHWTGDKATIAKELELDFFIDDRLENVESLHGAGIKTFLFDRPWNQTIETDPFPRVREWPQFVEAVRLYDLAHKNKQALDRLSAWKQGEEVRVTSETGGQKGQKLARIGSLDPQALMKVAEVAGFGEQKYDRLNYLKGYDWSLSYDACQRHLHAFWSGEDLDPESGLPHLAHAAWHCLAMLAFLQHGLGTDDRYRKNAA